MSENEKMTFGATIEPRASPLPLATRDAPPTPLTSASVPQSNPFYEHDGANRTSTDLKAPPAYAHDLEGQRSAADLSLAQTTSSRARATRDDSMWPSLKTQKEQARKAKCAKSRNPLTHMGKRQKMIATAVIALLIIGAAVGIGVGVSKAVNGGVKQANGDTRPIGAGNGA